MLTILKFIAAGGEPRKNCYTILGKRANIKTAREENWRFGDRKEKSLLIALGGLENYPTPKTMKVEGTDSVANVSGEGTAADDHQRKRRRKKAFMIRDILGEKDEDDEEKEDDEEEPGKDQEDKAASSPSPKLPAWIFCTRYSDRPSAGKLLCFVAPFPP